MDTEVLSQDATPPTTRTEIQEPITPRTKRSVHEMIANEVLSHIEEGVDHAFQPATLNAQGGICTVVYDVGEQGLLTLIHQEHSRGDTRKTNFEQFEVEKPPKYSRTSRWRIKHS